MLSKGETRWLIALQLKKHRKAEGLFIAEGPKVVDELLNEGFVPFKLYALESWFNSNSVQGEGLFPITQTELERISSLKTPNSVIGIFKLPKSPQINLSTPITLLLDKISDPGNLGTLIRLADWYGISQVICDEGTAEIYAPKTIQASMGSISRIHPHVMPLDHFLDEFSGSVLGATSEGRLDVHHLNPIPPPMALIIGSESHGISPPLLARCSAKIRIPRFGKAESLNAGVATGILLDNLVRLSRSSKR